MTNLGITFETVRDKMVTIMEHDLDKEEYSEKCIPVEEPIEIAHEIPDYLRANSYNLDYIVQDIQKQTAQQICWLVLKMLQELPAGDRTIIKVIPEEFSEHTVTKLLLQQFSKRTESLRIWCSLETYHLLRKQIHSNPSAYGSFTFSDLYMGVSVEVQKIPINEIWLIDPPLWKIFMTEPLKDTHYDFRHRAHTYTTNFRMSRPINLNTKLIRIQLVIEDKIQPSIENQKEKEMDALLDRMRIPNESKTIVDSSVWLRENPENSLVVTKPKPILVQKLSPVLFNPTLSEKD